MYDTQNEEDNMDIQSGAKVTMHYRLTVEGIEVDSSFGGDPLVYTHGNGEIVMGLENQLVGMGRGSKSSISVQPKDGYGEYDAAVVQDIPKTAFENEEGLVQGNLIEGEISGRPFQAIILKVDENSVTLDLNHPLAGKTLEFDVEILDITDTRA